MFYCAFVLRCGRKGLVINMKKYQAVIFDLDGVIVSTDEFHYLAWKCIADRERIPFDHEVNNRMRGVSRMASLDILLEAALRTYSEEEKQILAQEKNNYYVNLLANLKPDDILPGVIQLLENLKKYGVQVAVGSSSKNALFILKQIGLDNFFDAVVDGNQIVHTKPNPEVFLLAAKKLGLQPHQCVVLEDAPAGIEAAISGGFKAVAIGDAVKDIKLSSYKVHSLEQLDIEELISEA